MTASGPHERPPGGSIWRRWIAILLRFYPRRFRDRFGSDLQAQYRDARPSLAAAFDALRDLSRGGLGARFDDLRRSWSEFTWRTALENVHVDVQHVLRGFRRRPLFPLAIIATFALASSLNAAVFGMLDITLWRPLPFAEPHRIVSIGNMWTGFDHASVSVPEYLDYRARSHTAESMAVYTPASFNYSTNEGPERLLGARATASFFDVLGVQPALGRVFTENEDRPGAPGVVVLSHGLWMRRFGSDRGVIGRAMNLDSGPRTIVGVMPATFQFPAAETELWIPLSINTAAPAPRGNHNRLLIARIYNGRAVADMQGEMRAIAAALQREYPDAYPADSGWGISVRELGEHLFGDLRRPLSLLMAAVLFVLLIACANVASLMVARASEREQEIATRVALGAPRFRLVRQTLTEGLLLGLAGGASGLVFGGAAMTLLRSQIPERVPTPYSLVTDTRVALFALIVSAGAGLIAALVTHHANVTGVLRAHRSVAGGAQRLRTGLTAIEIALATSLLVTSGVAFRSFLQLVRADPGVAIEGVATARVTALTRYAERGALVGFYDRILLGLAGTPGVRHAGLVSILPLSGDASDMGFVIEGRINPGRQIPDEQIRGVAGDYFQAVGIPLMAGRFFDARDSTSSNRVAIVSALAAHKYWGETSPIGQRINLGGSNSTEPWTTIVGVVGDIRHRGMGSSFVPVVYTSARQYPERTMTLVAQLEPWQDGGPAIIGTAVRTIDPAQPVFMPRMMEDWLSRSVAEPRFTLTLAAAFAVLAVTLAAVGIYGVLASLVARRTRELGIRLALGGRPASLLALILRRAVGITLVGVAVGLAAGVIASTALDTTFVGVRPVDLPVLGVVVVAVLAMTLLAAYVPARRAMRVDPIVALRAE
jgi:putative ABC transport system permease protein